MSILLFMSLFSCTVPIKVDVDKALLIPKEQALEFLKTIKLDKTKYAPELYKDLHLDYVQWNEKDRIPYEDLEVYVNSFMGNYNVFLRFKDDDRRIHEYPCLVYSTDPPLGDFGQKTVNALVSLGADLKAKE